MPACAENANLPRIAMQKCKTVKYAPRVNSEKMSHKALLWLMLIACAMSAHAQWAKAPLQPPTAINPNLYRSDADARKEIREAISTAAKQHKRVLLVFGANWCIDCHVLERAFHQPRIEPLL